MKQHSISEEQKGQDHLEGKGQSLGESGVKFTLDLDQQIAEVRIKLREIVESLVVKSIDVKIPSLTVSEYFDRIAAYRMTYTGNRFNDFLNTIAVNILAKYPDTGLFEKSGANLNELVQNEGWVTEAAAELIEYRTLQQIRNTFDTQGLADRLLPMFLDEVNSRTAFKFGSAIVDLEAELSMCLTNNERRQFLELEYRSRLADYKQRTQTSVIKKYVDFDFTPIRWFTSDRLEKTCEGLVDNYVHDNELDEIELDLSLSRVFHGVNDEIKYETADLVTAWRVIEWIKNKIEQPFRLDKCENIDQLPNKMEGQLPILYIVPEVRQALYDAIAPFIDEPQRPDLMALFNGAISDFDTRVTLNCQQNEFAAAFYRSEAVPKGKAKLFSEILPNYFVRNDGRQIVELSPSTLEKHLRGIDLPKL